MASDFEPDERWFHSVFSSLRKQTVDATRGFTQRVLSRVEKVPDHMRAPAPLEVVSGVMVELLNGLTRALGAEPEETNDGAD